MILLNDWNWTHIRISHRGRQGGHLKPRELHCCESARDGFTETAQKKLLKEEGVRKERVTDLGGEDWDLKYSVS